MLRVLDPRKVFATRLKDARKVAGVSQKQLGVLAEIDEFVASARINRYEQGIHEPDLQTAARLAKAAGIPLPYLYADDDRLARLILAFSRLPRVEQERLVKMAEKL
jgi:transcriptional regulator with XRE-family HTH domain